MSSAANLVSFDSFVNIVDGSPRSAKSFHRGVDPTTKLDLWDVPIASAQDLEDAITSAKAAFQAWSQTTFEERQKLLKDFRRLLSDHSHELTKCLISETGKPKYVADIEIHSSLDMVDWYIKLDQPSLPNYMDNEKEIQNIYEPLGTVAAITPWNFPLLLPISKAVPAMLMGNVVIVKPSPFTP